MYLYMHTLLLYTVAIAMQYAHIFTHVLIGVSEMPAMIRRVQRELSGECSVQRAGASMKIKPG